MVRAKFVAVLANNAHKPAVPAILASFCLSNRITKRWWWESLYLYSITISRICPRVTVSVYGYICFWNRMVTLIWLGIIYEMISDVIHVEVSIYSEVFLFVITDLTHWGRVTHICVSELTIIGSDNGLPPDRRQAIIWTNDGILLIGPLGTNFSEIIIEIRIFSFKKMGFKVSSAKWRPLCLGLNVLRKCVWLRPGFPYSIMSQTLVAWHCTTVKVVYSTMALSSKMKIVKRITT